MDFTPQLIKALSIYWYLIPLFLLPVILKSPWFKGVLGEFLVNFLLNRFLPKDKYTLIKNVTLPTDDGTTQIDHIVVSQFGLFVLETKNMKGWIFGSSKQKQWTQKIFKYSGKFQNPLHQNYKHTQTLASCLAIPHEQIFSVIVFIGDSTFKTNMPENVTYARGCVDYIKAQQAVQFSSQQVAEIASKIETGRLARGFKTNLKHNKHVKTIVEAKRTTEAIFKKQDSNDLSCPKCGSEMMLREAKKGKNAGNKFWGCSSFPKCRKVLKVSP